MGCDIHTFIEFKIGDQPWTPDKRHRKSLDEPDGYNYNRVNEAESDRDYSVFAALAGVRGVGPQPKGIPDDVSELIAIALDQYGEDGHSHSYSSIEELEEALRNNDYFDESFYTDWSKLLAYCKKTIKQLQLDLEIEKIILGPQHNTNVECRILYFFDN
jgi:hypothetical protein